VFIDPLSAIPKYKQIAAYIQKQINTGEWAAHDPIPSERELEIKFNVSRTTIRQAIEYLLHNGQVYREHGKGTFVARQKEQHSLDHLTSFTNDMRSRGSKAGQKILTFEYRVPDQEATQALKIQVPGKKVLFIERLRFADGEPISIHRAFLNISDESEVDVKQLESYGSLYLLLEQEHGIVPIDADETIEATVSTKEESHLLNILDKSPLLLIKRIAYSQTRDPIEYAKMLYRADRYKCFVHMKRRDEFVR
jgi:GntR family transcriptional regulator